MFKTALRFSILKNLSYRKNSLKVTKILLKLLTVAALNKNKELYKFPLT